MSEFTRTINKPAADVYDYLTTPENFPEWIAGISSFEADSNIPSVGDKVKFKLSGPSLLLTYTNLKPNEQVSYDLTAPFGILSIYIHLEQTEPNITRLIKGHTYQLNFLGKLLSPLIKYISDKQVATEVDLIKQHAEQLE